MGSSEDDLIGQRITDLLITDTADTLPNAMKAVTQDGDTAIEATLDHPVNGQRTLSVRMRAFKPTAGGVSFEVACALRDITDERKQQMRLKRALERAESASEAKDTFLANMSHELRTPLNAILGFSEMMQHEVLGPIAPTAYKTHVGCINESGREMLRLVDDLLDISRMEACKLALEQDQVSVAEHVNEVLRQWGPRIARRDLKVTCRNIDILPPVVADTSSMQRIIGNMLSNALRYAATTGSVSIVGDSTAESVILRVEDDGDKPTDAMLAASQQILDRGNPAYIDSRNGATLSLALARALTLAQGGTFKTDHGTNGGMITILEMPRAQTSSNTGQRALEAVQNVLHPSKRRRPRKAVETGTL